MHNHPLTLLDGVVSPPAPPSPRTKKHFDSPPLPPPLPPSEPKASILKDSSLTTPKSGKKPIQEPEMPRDSLQEELRERVTLQAKLRKKWGQHLQQHTIGNTYLTPESTPNEVQEWLKEKEFSNRAQKVCKDLNGTSMFALTRAQLEKYLGNDEGPRLHSHLTVQKNICGFKPFKEHELSSILEERRRKSEQPNNSSNNNNTRRDKSEERQEPANDRLRNRSPDTLDHSVAAITLSSEDESDLPDVNAGQTLRVLLREQRRKIMDSGTQRSAKNY